MKNKIWSWIGDLSQVAGARHCELRSGRAKGTEAFGTRTGAGLAFMVVKDHAPDAVWASYKNTALSFITSNGVVASASFESRGNGFSRSFYAGLLTTYGLSYIGTPCEDEGETLRLHGHLAVTPVEEVGYRTKWTDDSIESAINGRVREIRLFGENLALERTIRCRYSEDVMRTEDKATNYGFTHRPLQTLCCSNYGWPLLSPQTEILLSAKSITPRASHAAEGLASRLEVCTPQPGFDEQVYYLTLGSDSQGMSKVALVNAKLRRGVYEKFDTMQLPDSIRWKNLGAGKYVMGLEINNSSPNGRDKERARGRLPFIEPGETEIYCLELGTIDGDTEISAPETETAGYRQLTAIETPGSVNRPGVGYVFC